MSRAAAGGGDGREGTLRLSRSEANRERMVAWVLGLAAALTVLTTAAVVIVLARETVGFFLDPAVSVWEFLTGDRWTPLFADKHFGILPLVTGTLLVTAIAVLVGVPLGLAGAIYLAEYAPRAGDAGSRASWSSLRGSRPWCSASSPSLTSRLGSRASSRASGSSTPFPPGS